MEHIIASYVIPAVAITMSVLFWISGRDSAKRAEQLLDEVTKTTRGWQNDIMKSTNQMLSSRPEIAAHSMYVAKIEAASKLTESIQTISKNIIDTPRGGEEAKLQYASLKMLLDYQIHYFKFIVDGKDLPPKMSEELENMMKGIRPQSQEKEYPEKQEEQPEK